MISYPGLLKAASMKASLKSSKELENWLSPKHACWARIRQKLISLQLPKKPCTAELTCNPSAGWDGREGEIRASLGLTGLPLVWPVNGLRGSVGDLSSKIRSVWLTNTREAEAGGFLWVQCQPDLHSKLQASQGFIESSLCLRKIKIK